ncbi:MAG TPA: PAS domain S-box protein, partial [Aggregatilineales bacterium]|nr:PAS domain S-box protein [Aggregatilineales bacterium]
ATEFINIPPHKIDEAIHDALQAISEFVGAHCCSISMLSHDMRTCTRTHVWAAAEFEPFIVEGQNTGVLGKGAQWVLKNLISKGSFMVADGTDLPEEITGLKKFAGKKQAQALMGISLILREKVIGFVTLYFPGSHSFHSEDTIKLMHVVGEAFVNALDRKQSDEEIRQLTAELEQRVIERTAALAESEQKFRSISEQALMGILIVQDGRIKYANQVVEEISKHPIADLLEWESHHYMEFIHPDDRPRLEQLLQHSLDELDPLAHARFRAYTRDGKLIWLEQFSRPIMYGGQMAILAMVVDITDLKHAEDVELQHRAFTKALLNTGMALSSTLDFSELIGHIFDNMQHVVKYDTAAILLKSENEILNAVARRGYPRDREYAQRLELNNFKYIPLVLETQQPLIVPDTRLDNHFLNHP